jgi:hypothetical protein
MIFSWPYESARQRIVIPGQFDSLTEADFVAADIDNVIAPCDYQECRQFHYEFANTSTAAESDGNAAMAKVYGLLSAVASLCLSMEDRQASFEPMMIMKDRRSAALSDFDASSLTALEYAANATQNTELLARISDVLWTLKNDYTWAIKAIRAYIDADFTAVLPGSHYGVHRLVRAVDLASEINKPELRAEAIAKIDALVDSAVSATALSNLPAEVAQHLLSRRDIDIARYSAIALTMGAKADAEEQRDLARRYWQLAIKAHTRLNEEEQVRAAHLLIASSYETDADIAERGHNSPHAVAAHWLGLAIDHLRLAGGQDAHIDKVLSRMHAHQKTSARLEMRAIETTEPLSEELIKGRDALVSALSGIGWLDAFVGLAFICKLVNVDQCRRMAEVELNDFVLSRIIGRKIVNTVGRTIGLIDPIVTGEEAEEDDLSKLMHLHSNTCRRFSVQVFIDPGRQKISCEHFVQPDDLMPYLIGHPFIEPGREAFFARGLCAGLRGDFVFATHILVPQLEHAIRYILARQGVISSTFTSEHIQNEHDLNRTLREEKFTKPLSELFGADLIFDLQGLLVSHFGANLRNELAHGLLPYPAFHSEEAQYVWWITLRLAMLPLKLSAMAQANQTNDVTPTETVC